MANGREIRIPVIAELQANTGNVKSFIDQLKSNLSNAKLGDEVSKQIKKSLDKASDAYDKMSFYTSQPLMDSASIKAAEREFLTAVSHIMKANQKLGDVSFGSLLLDQEDQDWIKAQKEKIEESRREARSIKRRGASNQTGKYLSRKDATAEEQDILRRAKTSGSKTFKETDSMGKNAKNLENEVAATQKKIEELDSQIAEKRKELENLQEKAKAGGNSELLKKTVEREEALQSKREERIASANKQLTFSEKMANGLAKGGIFYGKRPGTLSTSLEKFFRGYEGKGEEAGKLSSDVRGGLVGFLQSLGLDKNLAQDSIPNIVAEVMKAVKPEDEKKALDESAITKLAEASQKNLESSSNAAAARDKESAERGLANTELYKQKLEAAESRDKEITKLSEDTDNLEKQRTGYVKLADELNQVSAALQTFQNALTNKMVKSLEDSADKAEEELENFQEAKVEEARRNALDENLINQLRSQGSNAYGEQNAAMDSQQKAASEADSFKKDMQNAVKQWFSVREIINTVKTGIRQAYQDIQGLDKAMTNIAVVTDFSVSDLWGKINEYMSVAQQYGVTTQGVYEVSQLYYQQGLGESDVMAATTETLKMARIAGMDYASAADGMTVAIRGFKMEMTDAARVTDVYSKVAAVTASDTQELVEAMSKTASSAANVGSGFEETTSMLAVMIEATREAPSNIGSAMKSIISRYGEMTKGMTVDTEGEDIAFNKVDTALQSVGVSMKDATGQFREFDDVIFELASKWETLDSLSQRYVATVFAGNRQQSRFLALMSNYDRLVEVNEQAKNSEDAGLLQYSKTLDSLETKLNNIKTSFQQFYMDIFNGPVISAGLDFINNIIKGFNKLGKITSILNIGSIIGAVKVIGTLFVNSFANAFNQIAAAWKGTLTQMTGETQKSGIVAAQGWRGSFGIGTDSTTGKTVLTQRGTKIATGAMVGGSLLTMGGSAIASKNQTAGAIMSSAGNALSIGAQLAMINPILGVIGGAVAGLVSLFTSIPSKLEKAQQEAEKAAEKAEEANIKRAEAKDKARSLESGLENIRELEKKRFDNDEAMQEWIEANNSLSASFPELTVSFDEMGNAIINLQTAEESLRAAREAASRATIAAAEAERQNAINSYNATQSEIENAGTVNLKGAGFNTDELERMFLSKENYEILQENRAFFESNKAYYNPAVQTRNISLSNIVEANEALEKFGLGLLTEEEKATLSRPLGSWQTSMDEKQLIQAFLDRGIERKLLKDSSSIFKSLSGYTINGEKADQFSLRYDPLAKQAQATIDSMPQNYNLASEAFDEGDLAKGIFSVLDYFPDLDTLPDLSNLSDLEIVYEVINSILNNLDEAASREKLEKLDKLFPFFGFHDDKESQLSNWQDFMTYAQPLISNKKNSKNYVDSTEEGTIDSYISNAIGQKVNFEEEIKIDSFDALVRSNIKDHLQKEGLTSTSVNTKSEIAFKINELYGLYEKSLATFIDKDVEAFNQLTKDFKNGNVSQENFQLKLGEFLEVDSEIYDLYLQYYQEGFSKFQEKFIKSLQGKGNWDSFFGGEEIEFDEEGNLISELPESLKKYTQQQLEDISSFASSLEDKSNATGLDYSKVITSFTGILNSLEEWLPAEKVQQARDILSQAAADGNFFSVSGMQETIQELEDVGIDAEKLGISNIPVIAANLVTEYGALEDKLVSSLEEYEKAMKNASEGMDFSEAKKMAQKLGKDLSDSDVFTFNNGKWYADTALVQKAYQKDAAEQRVAVEKVNERQQQLLAGFSSAKSHENEPGAGQWLASATGKEAAWLFEQYEGAAMAAAGMTETEWNDLGIEGQTVQIQEYLASFNEALLAAYDKQAAYTTAAAIAAAEQAGFERDAAEIRTTKFFGDLGKFEDDIDDNGDVIISAEQKKQAEILRRQRMLSAMQNLASGETDYSEEEFSALAYGLGYESVEAFITATGAETTATGFSLSTASLLDLTTEIKDQYPEVYDALFGPLFANLEEEFNNILDTSRSIGSDIGDGGRMDMQAMEEAFGDTGLAQLWGEYFYENYLPTILDYAQSGAVFGQNALKNLIREANPGKTEEEVEQIYQEYISGYIEGINNAEDELADGIAQFVQDRAAGKEVSFSDLINKIKAVDPTSKINEAILENYLENPDNFDFEEYGITPDSSDAQLLKTIGETSHRASQEALSRYFELTLKQIEGTLTVEETIELSQISDQYAGIYNTITDSTLDYIKAVKGALTSGEVEFSQVEDSLKDAWASQLDSSAFGFDSELGGAMSEALQASSSKNGLDSEAMGRVLAGLTPYYDANVLGEAVRFNEKGKWNLDFDYLLENFNGRSVRDKAIATKLALRRGSQSDEEADALVDAYVAGDIDATTFRSRVQRMRGLNQGALEQAEELIEAATLPSELIEAEAEYYAITQQRYDSMTSSYGDIMSAAATGEKIDVQAVKELYDSLGVAVDADQLKAAASGNMEHLTNTIFDSLIEGVLKGEITQEQADALWSEVNATIKDSAISALSSGTSGLTSGAEGTLSAAEWNVAQQRYGLTKGTATLTARGVQLDDEAQLEYASKLYSEAQKSGLGWEAADVIWEQVKGSEGIFESWQSIEEAMQNCIDANGQIKDGYEEQYALLQQMSHSAILDPDDPMFTFMEQDATSGLTKNFDNFVGQIDKVKGALQGLQDSEEMSYNDFYNIIDFLGKSNQWESVSKQLGLTNTTIEDFATTVVSASETIGKVDAKGFAALGIDISTATSAMSEGMNESLKETARSQIKYLSGIEKMLMALQALEAIGDVELGLGIKIDTNGDGTEDTELTLDKILEYWEQIKNEPDLERNIRIKLEDLGDAGLNDLMKGLGAGDNFVKAFFGEDGFNLDSEVERQMADAWGEIAAAIPDDVFSNLTEGQAITLGQQMRTVLSEYMIFDKESGEFTGMKKGWETALKNWIKGADFSDIPEALNAEVQNQINQALSKVDGIELTDAGGIKIKDFDPKKGLSQDLANQIIAAYKAQGIDVADIEVDAEGYVTVKFVNKVTKAYIDGDGGWSQAETDIKNEINSIYNKKIDFNEEVDGTVNVKANIATGTFTVSSGGKDGEFGDAFDDSTGTWNIAKLEELIEAQMGPISDLTINGEGESATFSFKLDIQTPETTALTDIATNVSAIATILNTGLTLTITDENAQTVLDGVKTAYETLKNAIENDPIKIDIKAKQNNDDPQSQSEEVSGESTSTVKVQAEVDMLDASEIAKIISEYTNAIKKINSDIPRIQVENSVASTLDVEGIAERLKTQVAEINARLGGVAINIPVKGGSDASASNYTGTMNSITGPAYADGSIGRLFSGAQLANKTLVGELGPELAVYNGQYHLLGQTGAEFVKLPKNAIVFNHLQTAGILSGQMKDARGLPLEPGSALATGNVTGPAMAGGGIGAALDAVRRAKSVWQGLLNSLSAAELLGGGGGGGGGGGNDLKAHIADLQEWYNLSRKIADVEQRINKLLAERELLTDGHAYLRNLRETQALLEDQVNTQEDLLKFQELQLKRQAEHINNNDLWSKFLHVDENGLLQYNEGNEANGGKGALQILQEMNEMSGEEQTAYLASIGYTYTDNDGKVLEGSELVAKFYEELQKQIDDYDALHDTVSETETALLELEAQINEIEQEIRQNEIDLSQEIYDIIVDAWKENIENLKEQNELIKEANDAYAEGIQKAIDAERQTYEESEAIADREQLQRQLSLLRRSGGSAAEIASLEQQLDDTLKDEYFRNQEKALETIQEANERQVKLMEEQVKLQEEALEYQQENGVIWTNVYEVMQGTDAEILAFMQGHHTSFFEQSYLQQEDMLLDWAKKVGIYNEEKARQHAIEEAKQTFNQAWTTDTGKGLKSVFEGATDAEREKWKREYNEQYAAAILDGKTVEEAIKLAQEELYEHLENYKKKKESEANDNSNSNSSASSGNGSNNSSNGGGNNGATSNSQNSLIGKRYQAWGEKGSGARDYGTITTNKEAAKEEEKRLFSKAPYVWNGVRGPFAKGGLINFTGPAWVDGSKSKPERVLSAEQNRILEEGLAMNAGRGNSLKEALSYFASMLDSTIKGTITSITNKEQNSSIIVEPGAVVLNVEQLNDAYDIDELYNDITDRLQNIASRSSGRGVSRR